MRSIEWKVWFLGVVLCSGLSAARGFSSAYVGSQTCRPCHQEVLSTLMATPHGAIETGIAAGTKGEWKEHACESCHGPGAAHAGSADPTLIANPGKLPASEVDRICMSCHLGDEARAGRISGSHAKQGVSCIACHSVHHTAGNALVVRANSAVNTQCAACHRTVWASFQKPSGHRLAMNAMSCVDCHNPHGSVREGSHRDGSARADAGEPSCLQCHGDKRGPFTFEHAPVRLGGCVACHEPHNSVNPRSLIRHEVRLVCLECHANLPGPNAKTVALGVVPPSFHDLRSPRYRNCTICHQSIHGSYTDRYLIR